MHFCDSTSDECQACQYNNETIHNPSGNIFIYVAKVYSVRYDTFSPFQEFVLSEANEENTKGINKSIVLAFPLIKGKIQKGSKRILP
jgi:hypothetical protein